MSPINVAQRNIVFETVDTLSLAVQDHLPFWRDEVGHVVDANASRAQIIHGFRARIDRYFVDDLIFTDTVGDPVHLTRSVSRVSADRARGYAFHLVLSGELGTVKGGACKRSTAAVKECLLAIDLDQPFEHERPAHRLLNFIVPKSLVQETITDIDALHMQVVDRSAPLAALAFEHMTTLMRDMPHLEPEDAAHALRVGLRLLVASFNMDWRRNAASREAAHLAIMHRICRYIDANLHETSLNEAWLSKAFRVPPATLRGWFGNEGQVEGYIRYKRLRAAADQLICFPDRPVHEIAFGLAFHSVEDFTARFRAAFGVIPLDARAQGLALKSRAVFAR